MNKKTERLCLPERRGERQIEFLQPTKLIMFGVAVQSSPLSLSLSLIERLNSLNYCDQAYYFICISDWIKLLVYVL